MKNKILLVMVIITGILAMTSCGKKSKSELETKETVEETKKETQKEETTEETVKETIKETKKETEKEMTKRAYTSGDEISILETVSGFSNAANAMEGKDQVSSYGPGKYFVYKTYENGAINISKSPDVAGIWINPNKVNISLIAKASNKKTSNKKPSATKPDNGKSTDNKNIKTAGSTETTGWSWSHSSAYGRKVLKENNGYYNFGNKVYLTFDNGYEYQNITSDILDSLKAKNVKGVFFVTGSYIKDNPNLVKRMVREGHIVGNHTNKHLTPRKVSSERVIQDIKEWEDIYKSIIGELPTTKLYRPAEGVFSERTVAGAKKMGYKTILWGLAYKDWDTDNQPSTSESLSFLQKNTKSGDVVLLHSVSRTNSLILADYIDWLRANNFEIGNFDKIF